MAAPSQTLNLTPLSNQSSIAASGNADSGANAVNYSTAYRVHCQVSVTFGTVAATNGLRVRVFRAVDATTSSTFDTIGILDFTITGTASTTTRMPFTLDGGLYQFRVDNLDATNAVTNVKIQASTVSSIA